MGRPAKEFRQQIPLEDISRSDRTWSEELVQRGRPVGSKRLSATPGFRSYLAPPGATFLPPLRGSS